MRITCKANKGNALSPKYLDLGYTVDSEFHISIGKEYPVLAMVIWRSSLLLLLSDEDDQPAWCPLELFSISDSRIPQHWFFAAYPGNEDGLQFLWGYERTVVDNSHYDKLLERDPIALRVFGREKAAYLEL